MAKSVLQDLKWVGVVFPQAIKDNTEYVGSKGSTPVSVDTKGWSECAFVITTGATDIAHATLKIWESDDDSTYTAITGLNWATSPLTLPSATDDNTMVAGFIELGGNRKRYLQVELIPGDGTTGAYATVHAVLARAVEAPNSASERGLSQSASV